MKITTILLSSWNACQDGISWFSEKFPQGSEYLDVHAALRAENKHAWSNWLTSAAFDAALKDHTQIADFVVSEVADAQKATKDSPNKAEGDSSKAASSGDSSKAASSGDSSKAASSGDSSTAASSGDYSTAASSGYYSKAASSGYSSKAASSGYSSTAASSGYYSKAASSGYYSTAASSGYYSTAASSGYYSKAASSGDYSTAASSGDNTIAMVAGRNGQAKAGKNGCFALCWHDGQRNRIVAGYVGEDGIKADTWYAVKDGKLIEVAE